MGVWHAGLDMSMTGPTIPAAQVPGVEVPHQPSVALAIVGGLAATLVGAVVWGAITYFADFQVGLMATALGLVVGLAVRFFGGGRSVAFGVLAAVLALLGVFLGNLIFFTGAIAREESVGFLEVLVVLLANPGVIVNLFAATFEVIDVLFYGLAVYIAFRTASAVRPRSPSPGGTSGAVP